VREDAVAYNARVVQEFVEAVFLKADARNEAVNVILSAQNMRNYGHDASYYEGQAQAYLAKAKVNLGLNVPARQTAQATSRRDTSMERAPPRHFKARQIFNEEMLLEALEAHQRGDDSMLNRLARKTMGWRADTIPNRKERTVRDEATGRELHQDIAGRHHKFETLQLYPPHSKRVSFGEPMFQKMKRYLYKTEDETFGKNARLLDGKMRHVAKGLHADLRKPHQFTKWDGSNANLLAFYGKGYNQFLDTMRKKYGQQAPLLQSKQLPKVYLLIKNWINEGLDEKTVMNEIINDDASGLRREGRKGMTPAESLRDLAENDPQIESKRTGLIPYLFGTYMLPPEQNFEMCKWLLKQAGGLGTDADLGKILGVPAEDARGFMSHHSMLMGSVLNRMYAGGPQSRGHTQVVGNRRLKKVADENEEGRKARLDKLREGLNNGSEWHNIEDETLLQALSGVDMKDIAERFADRTGRIVVNEGGQYPEIDGDYIYMDEELPDLKRLHQGGFFEEDEDIYQELCDRTVNAFGDFEKSAGLREGLHGYLYTHDVKDDFEVNEEPVVEKTAKGLLMDGLGHHGNAHGEQGDINNLFHEAMPNVLFKEMDERTFLPARRRDENKRRTRATTEQTNTYEPSGDQELDEQTLAQLRQDLGDSPDLDEQVARFKSGKPVVVERDRLQDPMSATLEILPKGDAQEFAGDMPNPRIPATSSLHSFLAPFSDHITRGSVEPEEKGMDLVGFTSLESMPKSRHDVTHATPKRNLRATHTHARNSNSRNLTKSRQMPDSDLRNILHTKKDELTQEQQMVLMSLAMGAHHDLSIHDDDALDFFEELSKPENDGRRVEMLKNRLHHDPIGYGRKNPQLFNDLFEEETTPRFAIYDADEWKKWNDSEKLLHLQHNPMPEAVTHGIKTKNRLLNSLLELDNIYQNAGPRQKEQRKAELARLINEGKIEEGTHVGLRERHDEDEGVSLQGLVVAPTPAHIYKRKAAKVQRALTLAQRAGDEEETERLSQTLSAMNSNAPVESAGQETQKNMERYLTNMFESHRNTKTLFNMLRKGVEKHIPNAYNKGTNADHDMTAYTMRIAEMLQSLGPTARAKLMTTKNNLFYNGKRFTLGELFSEEEKRSIIDLSSQREVHEANESFASHLKDEHFEGRQPTAYKAALSVAQGAGGKKANARSTTIYEKVMAEVEKAAEEQGITFAEAFAARYYPHQRSGERYKYKNRALQAKPLEGYPNFANVNNEELRQQLVASFRNIKSGNLGGMHRSAEAQREGLLHGGDTVKVVNAKRQEKDINIYQEREAIREVMNHYLQETGKGSDVAMDFSTVARGFRGNVAMTAKKMMNFADPKSLLNFGLATGDTTKTGSATVLTGGKQAVGTSGGDFAHASPYPVNASRENQFHFGLPSKSTHTFNEDAMADGFLIIEDDNAHAYNPMPTTQSVMNRDPMRHVNRDLKPLNINDRQHINYAEFAQGMEPNPNIRVGQQIQNIMAHPTQQETPVTLNDDIMQYSLSLRLNALMDDTLFMKDDGRPPPVKFMHRIFDLEDMQHLRGFTGDWVISLYPQGEHVIATRKGKKFTAYGAEGEVKLDEAIVEEVDKVYEKDFTVHAILHDGIMTVLDLLKTADEDTHNMPTKDRIRHLRAQYESSEHIKMPEPINTKRSDDEGLQTAVDGLLKENEEDILLRDANATYMKGEPRHPKWVLLTKEKVVDVVILSVSGTTYGIGVGPLMHPEHYGKRAQQVGDEHYMNVGSAKGPRGLKVGDFATVRCTGVSVTKKEHPLYRIRAAKITDNEPFAANSVETLAIMAGDHNVPQKVSVKKGNIVVSFPAFDDEVICKTREEEGLWTIEPHSSLWGNEYLVKLARDQEPYWEASAALLLLKEKTEEPEYDEVVPEPPAGHSKKPKKVLEEEEEVIKRGLELLERGLEQLTKEKTTSTGIQGLGIGYATYDESPRGPTENIRDDTMPDFDPQARRDDELKPATAKKTKRLRSTEGEEATLEEDGVIAVEKSSFHIG
jgi:hypothetical protein